MHNIDIFKPKYYQIAEKIKQMILDNRLNLGDKLPTEKELIKNFGVSQSTIDSAMRLLIDEGMVVRKRRVGTVVSSPEAKDNTEKNTIPAHAIFFLGSSSGDIRKHPGVWFIFDQVSKGVINANNRHSIRLLNEEQLIPAIQAHTGPRGFICIGESTRKKYQDIIGNSPCIFKIATTSNFLEMNTVNCDNIVTAFNGMGYLMKDLGHREVAVIWGGQKAHLDNIAGYRMTLDVLKIPFRKKLVVDSGGGTEKEGYQAVEELIKRKVQFTAIFSDTDLKAIGAIQCLRDHKIRVPEDVSVIGCDDIPGITAEEGLTTVRRPFMEIGREMFRMLEWRMAHNNADIKSVTMYGRVIQRGTCRKLD